MESTGWPKGIFVAPLDVLPIFLVWMYLSWAVILFGAVLTASLAEWRAGGPPHRG